MSGPVTERGRVATAALAQSAPSQALAASAEVEMTPEHLEAQVEMELQKSEESDVD